MCCRCRLLDQNGAAFWPTHNSIIHVAITAVVQTQAMSTACQDERAAHAVLHWLLQAARSAAESRGRCCREAWQPTQQGSSSQCAAAAAGLLVPCLQVQMRPPQAFKHFWIGAFPCVCRSLPCKGRFGQCVSDRPVWILPLRWSIMTKPCRDQRRWAPCQCFDARQAWPGWCSKPPQEQEQEPQQMHQADTHLAQCGGFEGALPEGSRGDQHLDQALKLAPGAADACSGLAAQPGCPALQVLGLHKGVLSSDNPQKALGGSLLGATRPAHSIPFLAWSGTRHGTHEMKLSRPHSSQVA